MQSEQTETQSGDEHFGRAQTAYEYMKLRRSYVLHLHLELTQSPGKGSNAACAFRTAISPESIELCRLVSRLSLAR